MPLQRAGDRLFRQTRVTGDEDVDGLLDGADLVVENLDHRPDRGLDAGLVGLLRAAAFGLTQVAQLIEPADEGGERLRLGRWQGPGRLVGDEGGEAGEHSGIDRIGLRPSLAAARAKAPARLRCTPRSGRPSGAATSISGRS